jgi:hypothetical protein
MCEFYFNGLKMGLVEEFYMLHKCKEPVYFNRLRALTLRPHKLKTESRKMLESDYKLIDNWDDIKDEVIFLGLTLKFTQNPELMEKLLKTTGILEEKNNWGDKYWGTVNGDGKNKLGLMLTRIRDNISLNLNK